MRILHTAGPANIVKIIQNVERRKNHRPTSRSANRGDLVSSESHAQRLDTSYFVRLQILQRHDAAFRLDGVDYALGYVTSVEGIGALFGDRFERVGVRRSCQEGTDRKKFAIPGEPVRKRRMRVYPGRLGVVGVRRSRLDIDDLPYA